MKQEMDRREFIKDGLRNLLLIGFFLLGLVFELKRSPSAEQISDPLLQSPCRDCKKVRSCHRSHAFGLKSEKKQYCESYGSENEGADDE